MAGGLSRGDVVVAVAPGEYGKPRPAIVVQRELDVPLGSYILCPLSTTLLEAGPLRPVIDPDERNGLRHRSQAMIDKIAAIAARRIGGRIGRLSPEDLRRIDSILLYLLDLQRP